MSAHRIAALGAGIALLFAGCGGGGDGGGIGGTGISSGTMRVAVTDAPACGYDAVNVTIQRVRVHQSPTAAETDGGWSELVLPTPRRVDLLTLSNGVLEQLGETALPSGRYTQLRLVLADNSAGAPLANSVVPTGGVETPLDTPSAQQSGLKVNVGIDVPANQVVDVVLDVDACRSVVRRGNSGRYNLKPVIAAIPVLSDAGMRVVGYVDPALGTTATQVSVQQGGVPIRATAPDDTGRFVLYPVPVGSYDLVIGAPGRVTTLMSGVPVIATAYTNVSSALVPIVPPAALSAPRVVTGTVTPAVGSSVRALQSFSGGPTIEAAWSSVDATTGAFAFTLPVDAARRTAYVPNPVAITFVADAAVAGRYTLEATSAGATRTQAIDTNAVVPPIPFVFP